MLFINYEKFSRFDCNINDACNCMDLLCWSNMCVCVCVVSHLYIRSTKMPARIACATDRNFGFSSALRLVVANWRVNVDASHSRTSGGTASGCTSDSSSSSSASRLQAYAHTGYMSVRVECTVEPVHRTSIHPAIICTTNSECYCEITEIILSRASMIFCLCLIYADARCCYYVPAADGYLQ